MEVSRVVLNDTFSESPGSPYIVDAAPVGNGKATPPFQGMDGFAGFPFPSRSSIFVGRVPYWIDFRLLIFFVFIVTVSSRYSPSCQRCDGEIGRASGACLE